MEDTNQVLILRISAMVLLTITDVCGNKYAVVRRSLSVTVRLRC